MTKISDNKLVKLLTTRSYSDTDILIGLDNFTTQHSGYRSATEYLISDGVNECLCSIPLSETELDELSMTPVKVDRDGDNIVIESRNGVYTENAEGFLVQS